MSNERFSASEWLSAISRGAIAAAAEQVGEPAAEQQEAAEREHVGVDDP